MVDSGAKGVPGGSSKALLEEKVSMTFECPLLLAQAVEDEAKARNVSVSAVLRLALETMLGPRLQKRNDGAGLQEGAQKKSAGQGKDFRFDG